MSCFLEPTTNLQFHLCCPSLHHLLIKPFPISPTLQLLWQTTYSLPCSKTMMEPKILRIKQVPTITIFNNDDKQNHWFLLAPVPSKNFQVFWRPTFRTWLQLCWRNSNKPTRWHSSYFWPIRRLSDCRTPPEPLRSLIYLSLSPQETWVNSLYPFLYLLATQESITRCFWQLRTANSWQQTWLVSRRSL